MNVQLSTPPATTVNKITHKQYEITFFFIKNKDISIWKPGFFWSVVLTSTTMPEKCAMTHRLLQLFASRSSVGFLIYLLCPPIRSSADYSELVHQRATCCHLFVIQRQDKHNGCPPPAPLPSPPLLQRLAVSFQWGTSGLSIVFDHRALCLVVESISHLVTWRGALNQCSLDREGRGGTVW